MNLGCVSKDCFLQPAGRKREQFPLPQYGEGAYVIVQALGSMDMVQLQEKHGSGPQQTSNLGFGYERLAKCLVDDNGAPLFQDAAEVKAGMNVPLEVLTALIDKASEVSGLHVDRDEAKNV